MALLAVIFLLPLLLSFNDAAPLQWSPVVKTKSGSIRGQLIQLEASRGEIYQFVGIPFAEPPVGQRRYKKPNPVAAWNSSTIFNATKAPLPCVQMAGAPTLQMSLQSPLFGSEDCLYLNMWVPKWAIDAIAANGTLNGQSLLSTFIFIHGGGFWGGSASAYNGSVLAGFNQIIVVDIQYRLGSLGFAYYGTNDMPGNMGLWDQLEAMKWVYENIEAFGGNNSAITIGGQSSGGASVTFHMLSPKSRRYFQRAIVESGAATAPWATHTQRQATNVTDLMLQNVLSRKLCNDTTMKSPVADKIRCLMSVDATIFPRADVAGAAMAGFAIAFSPVIDGDFLPRDSTEMLRSGDFYKVPLLIGSTKNEGTLFLSMTPKGFEMLPSLYHPLLNRTVDDNLNLTHYRMLIQDSFNVYLSGLWNVTSLLRQAIELQYWPQNGAAGYPHGSEIAAAASDIIGDNSFLCPTYEWAQEDAKFSNNVYAYYFTHRMALDPNPEWTGVTHSAELSFVFGMPFWPDQEYYKQEDTFLSLVVMTYWANFIKYGDPNRGDGGVAAKNGLQLRKWPTHISDGCPRRFLEINIPKLVYGTSDNDAALCGLKAGDCLFWQDYIPQYMRLIATEQEDQVQQQQQQGINDVPCQSSTSTYHRNTAAAVSNAKHSVITGIGILSLACFTF